jgi:speckle-type POZ protein
MYFPKSGFMSCAEFEESPYLKDDRFTIHCDITVIKEPQVFTNMFLKEIEVPPPRDITVHLGKVLEAGVSSDVTFVVAGEVIAAHKRSCSRRGRPSSWRSSTGR